MRKIILKFIELIPFFSVIALLGFIGYWQMGQFKKIEYIESQLQAKQSPLAPLQAPQQAPQQASQQALLEQLLVQQKINNSAITHLKNSFENLMPELNYRSTISDPEIIEVSPASQKTEENIDIESSQTETKIPAETKEENNTIEESKIQKTEIMVTDIHDADIKKADLNKEAKPNREINRQLEICKKYLDDNQLTRGENGNAYTCYLSVLEKQPDNKRAISGIYQIEKKYERSIKKYIRQNNYPKAQRFLASLKQINPQNKNISSLQIKLNTANNSESSEDKAEPEPSLKKNIPQIKQPLSDERVDVKKNDKENDNFIKISSGCFKQDNKQICVHNNYSIGKYEVSQKQWQDIMGNNPSRFENCGNNCPVENVSWLDIQDFIRKLNQKTAKNYRLPTDAEWEYATRAGSTTQFYFGDNEQELSAYANYCDQQCTNDWKDSKHSDGAITTSPVGKYKPNAWGLYDTLGNVWEWVEVKNAEKQIYRGGSWGDNSELCRSSSKGEAKPDFHVSGIGFRLVHD